jgi:hypothetical protein
MVRTNIKMIHPAQIASWGYQGCKTVQGVVSFCQKNKKSINCVWWNADSRKILMIDPQTFRQTWKETHSMQKAVKPQQKKMAKTQVKKTQYKKVQARKGTTRPRLTAKTGTYKTAKRTIRKAA